MAEQAWLADAERAWRQPVPGPRLRAVIPVWRDPWMVVGPGTFTGDVAARLGLDNVYGGGTGRYPRVTLDDVAARRPDIVVLPDEPYGFIRGRRPGDVPRPARRARRGTQPDLVRTLPGNRPASPPVADRRGPPSGVLIDVRADPIPITAWPGAPGPPPVRCARRLAQVGA